MKKKNQSSLHVIDESPMFYCDIFYLVGWSWVNLLLFNEVEQNSIFLNDPFTYFHDFTNLGWENRGFIMDIVEKIW